MIQNYTKYNQESISHYRSYEEIEEAVDFLKNPDSFRSFDKGLIELLRRKNYPGDLHNPFEMSEYLYSKLKEIHASIEYETVFSWFCGEHRPKIESNSRQKIYEICFALHLTYQETVWFFQHVYYDRAFNCHTVTEAVFFYAFLNGIPYETSLKIIDEIDQAPIDVNDYSDAGPNYTQFVQNRICEFQSTDELKAFLTANKENFTSWNHSALETLEKLRKELVASDHAKEGIDNLKRTLSRQRKAQNKENHTGSKEKEDLSSLSRDYYEECGLLIKELFYDAAKPDCYTSPGRYVLEAIQGKNIQKNTFLLDRLLCTVSGIPKTDQIPYIVRNNFPSKKVMSDLLSESKISVSKSYDAIRKMIVLLDFYSFWVRIKIGLTDVSGYTRDDLYEIYLAEANNRLYQCGYEELYAGNPYDWIFLWAAQRESPVDFFRSCIADLLPEG